MTPLWLLDWQGLAVLAAVLLAALMLGRATYRTWFADLTGSCGSGCGSCGHSERAVAATEDVPEGRRIPLA